jgi:hypothetical protein
MKLMIVAGSHAEQSQSARIAECLKRRAIELNLCLASEVQIHDLGSDPLPLWNASHRDAPSRHGEFLQACNALVLISPDWHGMATPAIKNWFYHLPPLALEHKPVLLCGVSAGDGGLYPVMDLRTHSFKNFRPCYLPEQLIIRKVREQFLGAPGAGAERSVTRDRADYCLRLLQTYASGFDSIRQRLPERDVAFSYGM